MTDTPPPTDTPPDNVVPGDTFMRKSLIRQNTTAMNEAIERLSALFKQFQAGGIPSTEWLPHLIALFPEPYRTKMIEGQSAKYLSMILELVVPMLQGDLAKALQSPAMLESLNLPLPFPGGNGASASSFLPSMLAGMFAPQQQRAPMPPPMPSAIGLHRATLPGTLSREECLRQLDVVSAGFEQRFEVVAVDPTVVDGKPATEVLFKHRLDAPDEYPEVGNLPDDTTRATRMRATIARLFAEAPRMTLPDGTPDPSQAPALECYVLLRGCPAAIQGIVSTTPEGGLRMMTPSEVADKDAPPPAHPRAPRPTKMVMIEQFFDYEDVITIAVQREVKASPGTSSLIS
jgi:hypothetical protein